MLELLTELWKQQGEDEPWQRGDAGGAGVSGRGGRRGGELDDGLPTQMAPNVWSSLFEMATRLTSRAYAPMRVALFFTLLVVMVIFLMRPRRRTELADLMGWMGGNRRELSELGVAGVHLDRWPLAVRRGEERERWRSLRPPPRRVRSEGDLCNAAILADLSRTPRVRTCRTI